MKLWKKTKAWFPSFWLATLAFFFSSYSLLVPAPSFQPWDLVFCLTQQKLQFMQLRTVGRHRILHKSCHNLAWDAFPAAKPTNSRWLTKTHATTETAEPRTRTLPVTLIAACPSWADVNMSSSLPTSFPFAIEDRGKHDLDKGTRKCATERFAKKWTLTFLFMPFYFSPWLFGVSVKSTFSLLNQPILI